MNLRELPLKKNRMVKLVVFLNISCRGVPLPEVPRVPRGEAAGSGTAELASAVRPTEGGKVIHFLCNLFQLQ